MREYNDKRNNKSNQGNTKFKFMADRISQFKLPKLIVILGPTASGKTGWSLALAKEFGGEIISADSRQLYKKMDIGSAKPVGNWQWRGLRRVFMIEGIPHYLVDCLDPGKSFSAAEWRDSALKYAKVVERNDSVPFLVGGTGQYLSALVDNWSIPRVPPNKKLRESLESKSLAELVALLTRLDQKCLEFIDTKNKRRLIRALEVCILTGELFSTLRKKGEPLFEILQIGIQVEKDELQRRIDERVEKMIDNGLETEVRKLIKQKCSWQLPSMSGIGYREWRDFLAGKKTIAQVKLDIAQNTRDFAKRQLTWFNKDKRTKWCYTLDEAHDLVNSFLAN
jgi:tRNA dimethylallyltransferase